MNRKAAKRLGLKPEKKTGTVKPLIEGEIYVLVKNKWQLRFCKLFSNRFCIYKIKRRKNKLETEITFGVEHYVQKLVNRRILDERQHGFILSNFEKKFYFSGKEQLATQYWQTAIGGAILKLDDGNESYFAEPELDLENKYEERVAAFMKSRGARPDSALDKETELEQEAAIAETFVDEARFKVERAMLLSFRLENEDLSILREEQKKFEEEQRKREEEEEREKRKREEEEAALQAAKERERKKREEEERIRLEQIKAENQRQEEEKRLKREKEEREKRELEERRKREEEVIKERIERQKLMEAEKQRLEDLLRQKEEAIARAKDQEKREMEALRIAEKLAADAQRKRLIEAKRISVIPFAFDLNKEMEKYTAEKKVALSPPQVNRRSMILFQKNQNRRANQLSSFSSFEEVDIDSPSPSSPSPSSPKPSTPKPSSPKVKRAPKAGLAARLAMWQNKIDDQIQGQKQNVFSGQFQEQNYLKKGDAGYGQAKKGTKTAARAAAAADWVEQEVQKLCDKIVELGRYDDITGGYTIEFGKLFVAYENISDSVVGILKSAKKRNKLHYAGDMLFQGIHDKVLITVIDNLEV